MRDDPRPHYPRAPEAAADSPLKPFAASLSKGIKEALSALDERSKAKGARQAASNEIDEWKEGINALRTTTYAELLKVATEKGLGKAWGETFFRSSSSASGSDAETESSETSEPASGAAPSPPA
jgi:hypothetical protein